MTFLVWQVISPKQALSLALDCRLLKGNGGSTSPVFGKSLAHNRQSVDKKWFKEHKQWKKKQELLMMWVGGKAETVLFKEIKCTERLLTMPCTILKKN